MVSFPFFHRLEYFSVGKKPWNWIERERERGVRGEKKMYLIDKNFPLDLKIERKTIIVCVCVWLSTDETTKCLVGSKYCSWWAPEECIRLIVLELPYTRIVPRNEFFFWQKTLTKKKKSNASGWEWSKEIKSKSRKRKRKNKSIKNDADWCKTNDIPLFLYFNCACVWACGGVSKMDGCMNVSS